MRCSDVCVWIPGIFFFPTHFYAFTYACARHMPLRARALAGLQVRGMLVYLCAHVQRVRSPLHSIHLAHKHIRLLAKRAASVLLSWGCKYLVCCINTAAFKECRIRKRQKCFIPTPDNRKTGFVDSSKCAARGATKISTHSFETMFLSR